MTQPMTASLEFISGCLRVHATGGYGQPYTWACTAHAVPSGPGEPKDIELKGFERTPNRKESRAICSTLADKGFDRVIWFRDKDTRVHKVDLGRFRRRINGAA